VDVRRLFPRCSPLVPLLDDYPTPVRIEIFRWPVVNGDYTQTPVRRAMSAIGISRQLLLVRPEGELRWAAATYLAGFPLGLSKKVKFFSASWSM